MSSDVKSTKPESTAAVRARALERLMRELGQIAGSVTEMKQQLELLIVTTRPPRGRAQRQTR